MLSCRSFMGYPDSVRREALTGVIRERRMWLLGRFRAMSQSGEESSDLAPAGLLACIDGAWGEKESLGKVAVAQALGSGDKHFPFLIRQGTIARGGAEKGADGLDLFGGGENPGSILIGAESERIRGPRFHQGRLCGWRLQRDARGDAGARSCWRWQKERWRGQARGGVAARG